MPGYKSTLALGATECYGGFPHQTPIRDLFQILTSIIDIG